MNGKRVTKILIILGTLVLGCFLGWLYGSSGKETHAEPVPIKDDAGSRKFINPVLFTETDKNLYSEYNHLEDKLKDYIKTVTDAHTAQNVSVYFRDLNSGIWTGVNEDEKYHPGSMLKLAVLLGYLRAAETDPGVLSKQLEYTAGDYAGQFFPPENPLKTGRYTVQELINAMIIKSDNIATELLIANDQKDYSEIYKTFQLPIPSSDPSTTDFMSPKSYSSLWRTLYNAKYLSPTVSDEVLDLLTQTGFDKGLVSGVPSGVVVAHKFGEHTNLYGGGNLVEHQLHDCGIVYFTEKPYFLCVMTRGADFTKLESVIAGISKITYDYIKNN